MDEVRDLDNVLSMFSSMLTFDDFLKGLKANGASVCTNREQFYLSSYFLTTSSRLIDSLLVQSSSDPRAYLISKRRFVYSLKRDDKSGMT